jgi:carbon-monoxide dehydrogenase medium subunit
MAETFEEASELLSEHDAKPIAGGSAVITLMNEGVLQPQPLVNLRRLKTEHAYIREENGELCIGALTTLRMIETHDLVRERLPIVSESVAEIASLRVRNAATIGGHLAHADPDLDLPPVLAGLDAEIVVHSPDGDRTVPLTEFIQGFYQTDLDKGELVKAVRVPVSTDRNGVYLKHRARSDADWPCVGVAAFLDGDTDVPEVFMNSVADSPIFSIDGIEDAVNGELDAEAADRIGNLAREQCDPIGDGRGTEWYKREMAKEFTVRAVRSVAGVEPAIPAEGGA